MRLAVLLLLTSCGDNLIPRDPFEAQSGSRIALRVYTYADGTTQWDPNVFFDRERLEPCTVQRWSDGHTYCTPTARPTVYTEPNCMDGELGRWLTTQRAPTYFYREYSTPTGDVISRVFHGAGDVAAPATTYEIANGRCVETTAAGWTYYALDGESLAADQFARLKRIEPTGTARLRLDAYKTDDGFYMPIELLHDRELGGECKIVAQPNAQFTTCEPAFAGEAEFSRDSRCATTDLIVVEGAATVPDVVLLQDEGCRTYRRRGAEIERVPVFLPLGDNCVSVNLPSDAHLFEVGEPFEVPALARRHEPSPRRLQRILSSDGETTVLEPLLFDSELGVDCARMLVGDTQRCLPANTFATVTPYFRDPACTQPIEISLVESGLCDAATRFAIDHRSGVPVVRPLGDPYPQPLYEISTSDTCLEYIPPMRQKAFTVGEAMPATAFVEVTSVAP